MEHYGAINLHGARQPAADRLRQLPAPPADFTGREAEIEQVISWLNEPGTPRLVNVYGLSGTGKSALAAMVGRQVTALFPDAQIYLDLRDDQGRPVPAGDLLGGLLGMLGYPAIEIPASTSMRSALLRSALAHRQVLMLLDNVHDAGQIMPLLPGSHDCAVLTTSWWRLSDLPGVRSLPLHPMGVPAATALLTTVAQRPPADGELRSVQAVVDGCGGLPLALRIAGGLLCGNDSWTWKDLAERLLAADGTARIGGLRTDNLAVAASFTLAYDALCPQTARAFRLLGLATADDISVDVLVHLLDADAETGRGLCDELVRRQLLQPGPGTAFTMHSLLWKFARHQLTAHETPAEIDAAAGRLMSWSLTLLQTRYLPRLIDRHAMIPSLDGVDQLPLDHCYVTTHLTDDIENPGGPMSLDEVFPARRYLAVVAAGGAGKSTMLVHLCRTLATGTDRVPFLLIARDLPFTDAEPDLEAMIVRSLRYQYGVTIGRDVVVVALRTGRCVLTIDGVDEVVGDAARARLFTTLGDFVQRYPDVAILISSRPHPGLDANLAGFTMMTIAPWGQAQRLDFLRRLAVTQPHGSAHLMERLLAHGRFPASLDTPLGLLIALRVVAERRRLPSSWAEVMEAVVVGQLVGREGRRGIAEVHDNTRVLQLASWIAYNMQTSDHRAYVEEDHLRELLQAPAFMWNHAGEAGELMHLLNRSGIFTRIGTRSGTETVYGFVHTAYREYFVARHLAYEDAIVVITAIRRWRGDASWEAVIRQTVDLLAWNGRRGVLEWIYRRYPEFRPPVPSS